MVTARGRKVSSKKKIKTLMYFAIFIWLCQSIQLYKRVLFLGFCVVILINSCPLEVLLATGCFLADQLGGYLDSKGGAAPHTSIRSTASLIVCNILRAPRWQTPPFNSSPLSQLSTSVAPLFRTSVVLQVRHSAGALLRAFAPLPLDILAVVPMPNRWVLMMIPPGNRWVLTIVSVLNRLVLMVVPMPNRQALTMVPTQSRWVFTMMPPGNQRVLTMVSVLNRLVLAVVPSEYSQ